MVGIASDGDVKLSAGRGRAEGEIRREGRGGRAC